MSVAPNQRLKLLYLAKILMERTDEQHSMTLVEIVAALGTYNIKAERKSLYNDFELLRSFGLDIESQRSKTTSYYIASRRFELAELKLLVDAVQSSRFITAKKSEKLIKKLASLTSDTQASELRRHVFVTDRAKTVNETVLYSIDHIHTAINSEKQIAFKYFDYSPKKRRIYRKDGELYQTTPVSFCWNDDKYYLIAYSAKYDDLTHYRVDRMSDVTVLDIEADSFDQRRFNIPARIKQMFGMYAGELVRATLSFENDLANAVLDHFGKDIVMTPGETGWFDITVDVAISPALLARIIQFEGRAIIKSPESLIAAMQGLLAINQNKYSST